MTKTVHLRRLMTIALGASFIWTSCINEDYDLEKEIDKNVSVLQNLSMPIGSFEKIVLNDILELTEDMSMIDIAANGDIALCVRNLDEALTQSVTVPSFKFSDCYKGNIVETSLGSFDFIYDPAYSDLIEELSKPVDFKYDLKFEFTQNNIPDIVKEIGYSEVEATASINLSVLCNKQLPLSASIAEGTRISFPDWVILGDVGSDFIKQGSSIIFNKDVQLSVSTSDAPEDIVLSVPIVGIDGTRLPENQGIQSNGTFMMNEKITIDGKAYFDITTDEKVYESNVSPVISSYVSFTDLNIINVEVKLSSDIEDELASGIHPVKLEDIPEFLRDAGIVLDVNELRLDIDFTNPTPFAGNVSVCIVTSSEDKLLATVPIGPIDFEAGSIDSPKVMKWSFIDSSRNLAAPEGYTAYKTSGLTDLVKRIPDFIEFKDFEFSINDDFVRVVPGDEYVLSQKFTIFSPLAFGEEFNLPYNYTIKDLGLSFDEADLKSAVLELDVESTLPMNFTIDVAALDENGSTIDGLSFNLRDNNTIKAGSLASPNVSNLVFELKNTTGSIKIDGLELRLCASAPESRYLGIPLNINQGLHFKNILLNLPDGISADIDGLL